LRETRRAKLLRVKSDFLSNLKLIWVVSLANKNISLAISENQNYNLTCLVPTRGAYRHRHDTLGAGCDGRGGPKANVLLRTVKSCGSGAAYAGEARSTGKSTK
jgi:hypothetical protein